MAIQTELVRGIDGRPNDQPGSAALHGQAYGRKNNRGQCEPRFADLAARYDHSDDPRSSRTNLSRGGTTFIQRPIGATDSTSALPASTVASEISLLCCLDDEVSDLLRK